MSVVPGVVFVAHHSGYTLLMEFVPNVILPVPVHENICIKPESILPFMVTVMPVAIASLAPGSNFKVMFGVTVSSVEKV
jgi:hypothetical protein